MSSRVRTIDEDDVGGSGTFAIESALPQGAQQPDNIMIKEQCSEICGYAAAMAAAFAFGSFGVPVKSKVASRLDIDPLVMQANHFVSHHGELFPVAFGFRVALRGFMEYETLELHSQ
ncbi:predicted protein [Thalassiosira pseudonana CCMP1335]|uniref:Uncharacterized protein n=1 Tax=Thalassiosira pseudonana TaxID=35128 RepID=B8BYW2_THAPS|nr:predicted protein [Thalassiosira pseudonana CCMP1335]EED93958.1 predicted protein [Thalassiosira pseudonana CCMP1335]